ncbi:hypothetical protein [Roseofilum casamattae]|uniref:CRISPR-associated protein Cmr3 n=1 Tax=Roseofilum casamattae BLCC-M143 TaxID=3022442 RepID=A0ABT7BS18_9CYAN|nr:hypothetical protein [Roseofilum casamattae]MDJ1181976.1 CRISPR-associated protein Cmr3 [Roseofilum casamattae BLCC-M143]
MSLDFKYLITIELLGLLNSNLSQFPPDTPTLSGIYAMEYNGDDLKELQLSGPFWAKKEAPQRFYVPSPFNYVINSRRIDDRATWNGQQWQTRSGLFLPKPSINSNYWIAIQDWHNPQYAEPNPWVISSFSHACLDKNERTLNVNGERNPVFREDAVQMQEDTCIVYLANLELPDGWYRFGGKGHIVNLCCHELEEATQQQLNQYPGKSFALITPAVWGSRRLSYQEPAIAKSPQWQPAWDIETMLSSPPKVFRYRLGGQGKVKRLSRGRYAVPAGSVYILRSPLEQPWQDWPDDWFPKEAYSFKRWGCSLVLPLENAIAEKSIP